MAKAVESCSAAVAIDSGDATDSGIGTDGAELSSPLANSEGQ